MYCILSPIHDIYYNLAAEEYFLKNTTEEICMLWKSDECVVVGKHQNAMAEVNYLWTHENKVPVARRLTGGGTVYHGPGNLNFTFIRNGEQGKLVDFNRFVSPVIDFLTSIGVHAEAGKRNDILVNGLKISGNAEHVHKTRVLHHGTLLYDADLSKLNKSIAVDKNKYSDKAVQSIRSSVTNLIQLISPEKSFDRFESELSTYLQHYFTESIVYELSSAEDSIINELKREKYMTNKWIFGYSPPFNFTNTIRWKGSNLKISINVNKGIIQKVKFYSETKSSLWSLLEDNMPDCVYLLPDIEDRIKKLIPEESSELARHFF